MKAQKKYLVVFAHAFEEFRLPVSKIFSRFTRSIFIETYHLANQSIKASNFWLNN